MWARLLRNASQVDDSDRRRQGNGSTGERSRHTEVQSPVFPAGWNGALPVLWLVWLVSAEVSGPRVSEACRVNSVNSNGGRVQVRRQVRTFRLACGCRLMSVQICWLFWRRKRQPWNWQDQRSGCPVGKRGTCSLYVRMHLCSTNTYRQSMTMVMPLLLFQFPYASKLQRSMG